MFWSAFDGSCVFNLNIKEEFVSKVWGKGFARIKIGSLDSFSDNLGKEGGTEVAAQKALSFMILFRKKYSPTYSFC